MQHADNLTFRYRLRQQDTLLVVCQTGENLIRHAVFQSDKRNPFVLVVLEAHHVAFQFSRAHTHLVLEAYAVLLLFLVFLLLLFLLHAFQHPHAAAVAIHGASLAPAAPCLFVELPYQFLRHVVRQVDGYGDGVVNPFLDSTLHLHFL